MIKNKYINSEMEKPNGKLLFYGDEVPITFPLLYNQLLALLNEIFGLEENVLSNIKLSYRDQDENKIEIKSEDDYRIFITNSQKGKQMIMTIEVNEESNLDIKKCSSSILNYVEKKSGNINNLSEEIKKNSLELDEVSEIKNERILDLDENISSGFGVDGKNEENSKKLIIDNNINNINNYINQNNNNQNKFKPEEENKNLQQNKSINNQIQIQQQNNNNINQNPFQQQNNNLNNMNQIPLNSNMPQVYQPNYYPQMSQYNNISQFSQMSQPSQSIMMGQYDLNKLSNKYLYMLSYPFPCALCKTYPIYRVMYYCKGCAIVICENCEKREGEGHVHPFYKVQNISQFEFLNINNITKRDPLMNVFERSYNFALDYIWKGKDPLNDPENSYEKNRIQRQKQTAQLVSVVQMARNMYDLRNFSDQQIEEALIKEQGNIDQAVISLVPK